MTRALPACLIFAVLGAALAADEVRVVGLDGSVLRGEIVQLAPELVVRSGTGERTLAWGEVLELAPIRATPDAVRAPALPWRVSLTDGSSFAAALDGPDGDAIKLILDAGLSVRVPVDALRTVALADPPAPAITLVRRLLESRSDSTEAADAAVVFGADKAIAIEGAVQSTSAERVVFRWNAQDRTLRWNQIAAVRFAANPTRAAPMQLRLVGGDVIAGRLAETRGADSIGFQSDVLGALRFPWARIARIECRSERVVFLSNLDPIQYEFDSLFTTRFEPVADASLTHRPIVLGGREYAKGVSQRSRSRISYRIGGRFRQFAATAGVLDEMGERGDVDLAVYADGRSVWSAAHVRGGAEPLNVSVDVEGVQMLTLEVDWGDGLDLSDHACWAMARLTR